MINTNIITVFIQKKLHTHLENTIHVGFLLISSSILGWQISNYLNVRNTEVEAVLCTYLPYRNNTKVTFKTFIAGKLLKVF